MPAIPSFYLFTRDFGARVGQVGSFVWASYTGLWHLRERAQELGKVSTVPEWKKISDYLTHSVPGTGSIDLNPLVNSPWSSSEAAFCDLILTLAAISYEEWCIELAQMTTVAGKKVKAETYQFPSSARSTKWTNWSELEVAGVMPTSSFMEAQIRPGLLSAFANDVANLDANLKWYRHFKEMRNAVAHHGGIARPENEVAYDNAVATPLKRTGISRDYLGPRPVSGQRVQLTVADATLFLALIQRLACGFDAKFCHTLHAEKNLSDRVSERLAHTRRPPGAATKSKKNQWIKGFLHRNLHIYPASLDEAEKWLQSKDLVAIRMLLI